jgi:putative inorganic carbon (HCO3(-)) transporter
VVSGPSSGADGAAPRAATGWKLPVEPGRERVGFALFAGQLFAAWAIALSNILLGAATIAALASGRPALRSLEARRLARLACAYLVLLVAAVAASQDVRASVRALSELFSFGALGLALIYLRGEQRVRWLADGVILVGTLVAAHGLAQLLIGMGDVESRIRGPFSHYMTFAGFLLPIDLLLVARLLRRRARADSGPTGLLDRAWVAWLCLSAISVALVSSLTRSAWLALAVGLALLVLLVRPKLLLLAPPAAAVLLVVLPVPMVHRLLSIADRSDQSNYDRICMAEAGLRMIAERPLLGLGPDLVKRIYPLYRHPTAPRLLVPHLHNSYIQIAAERGIPALAVYLALLGTALASAWRGFRGGGAAADLHLGVLGALVAFAVASLFEHNWGDSEVQRLALFLIAIPVALEAEPHRA